MSKVRKVGKGFIAAFLLGSISFLLFFLYMVVVGIPKTQARNYFNLAESYIEKGSIDLAKGYLERALEFWPENYIQERLDSIR